jgi:hypothetical protein
VQLRTVGQLSEKQQIGYLFKPERAVADMGFNYIFDIYSPVIKLPGDRYGFSVLDYVALNAAYASDPYKHSGTVGIAQSPFDIVVIKMFRLDPVIFFDIFA